MTDPRQIVITGATSGIGQQTALRLSEMGHRLALVARSKTRAEATTRRIHARTPGAVVEWFFADLSVQKDVHKLAESLRERIDTIDVLINNAGVMSLSRKTTANGLEVTFAVNHMAYFILTQGLLDHMSENSRIVNVASAAHFGVELDFDDLQSEEAYHGFGVYKRSKLCNVLYTSELARRLEGRTVTVNCCHPGFVASRFAHNNGLLARAALLAMRPWMISSKRGAETPTYLAVSPEADGVTGKYFDECKVRRSSRASQDPESAARLWKLSEELIQPQEES